MYQQSSTPTTLLDFLSLYNNDQLKKLVKLLGGGSIYARKDLLTGFLTERLLNPVTLRTYWEKLDPLSKQAVAAAYHNEGNFDTDAFEAQHLALPARTKDSIYTYEISLIMLDAFLFRPSWYSYGSSTARIPQDMLPLVGAFVPPPERFQVTGVSQTPTTFAIAKGKPITLLQAENEEAGWHDLLIYLQLWEQGLVDSSNSNEWKLTPTSTQKLLESMLREDFFPLPDKPKYDETIRLVGLHTFMQGTDWVSTNRTRLSTQAKTFLRSQEPALLLEAFEQWSEQSNFDELIRLPVIKGQRSKNIALTPPAKRRAAIIEALSWCPTGVWIAIEDFYRAVRAWHFDVPLEKGGEHLLYIGYSTQVREYGWASKQGQWLLTKGLYINTILWESLGSIGALDLLYTSPEDAYLSEAAHYHEDKFYSSYDGLKYFRITPLGAFLLGQASSYQPKSTLDQALFTITADLQVKLLDPDAVTPVLHHQLTQVAIDKGNGCYRLDRATLLTSLEEGGDFERLTSVLSERNQGDLPPTAQEWLNTIQKNSRAFRKGSQAILINASAELVEMVMSDPALKKISHVVDAKTLVIAAARERTFRNRLKEVGYGMES